MDQPIDPGTPGASLEREYARRKLAHENKIRGRYPRIGGIMLALSKERTSTAAFARGADGERRLAAWLEKRCGDGVLLLHNRGRGRGRKGDIDHLAVTASGIFIIDAKHYAGAKVTVRRTGGLFGPATEKLFVRGRDKTSFVDSLKRQHEAVMSAIEDPAVPVTALLCFLDAELPLFGTLSIAGFPILTPRRTVRVLMQRGPLDAGQRQQLYGRLAAALPPA